MKENSLDSHRGKVVESKAVAAAAAAIRSESTASTTNFDDDYNEWELGIGDLIIDLDADIEKNNEKGNNSSSSSTAATTTTTTTTTTSVNNNNNNNNSNSQGHHHLQHQAALQQSNFAMSSGKNKLNSSSSSSNTGGGGVGAGGISGNGNNVEHQATVDKGLKMKIKRTKPTKTSEAKHEIVKPSSPPEGVNGATAAVLGSVSSNSTVIPTAGSVAVTTGSGGTVGNSETVSGGGGSTTSGSGGKSKHASSKGRGGSHREKKDRVKERDRDKERSGVGAGTGKGSSSLSSNASNSDTGGSSLASSSSSSSSSTTSSSSSSNGSLSSSTIKLSNSSTINVASLPTATVNLGVPANVNSLGLSTSSLSTGSGSSQSMNCSSGSSSSSSNSSSSSLSLSNGSSTSVVGSSVSPVVTCVPPSTTSSTTSTSGGVSSTVQTGGGSSFGCTSGVASNSVGSSGGGGGSASGGGSVPNTGVTNVATAAVTPPSLVSVKMEPKFPNVSIGNFASIKLEDSIRALPSNKRIRVSLDKVNEKSMESGRTSPKTPEMQDVCVGTSVGTITEPECLGPCEPGTTVTLEGIVWQETEGGVLVVNVTWRGKTYVGTLLDCTKHDWAPPRFCESPTSDVESRTPKGRGKRGRANATVTTVENTTETRSSIHSKLRNAGKGRRTSNSGFTAPPSPAKPSENQPIVGVKRKGRPMELELLQPIEVKSSKRSRSQSRGTPTNTNACPNGGTPTEQPSSPVLIECPEPNCSKKYKHINGLRYHQTHAHHSNASNAAGVEDSPDDQNMKDVSSENDESTQEGVDQSPGLPSPSEKTLRSSPRPFTGKVPPAPPAISASIMTDQKPTVDSSVGASLSPMGTDGDSLQIAQTCNSDLGTLASVAIGDSNKVTVPKGVSNGPNSVLRFGQSSNTSVNSVGSQGQTESTLPTSVVSQSGAAGSKVSSPLSNSMPVINSSTRAASPVPGTAAPPSLSPIPPHQSPRNAVPMQQPLGATSQIYHHHPYVHPSAALGLDCSIGGAGLGSVPPSASSPVVGSMRPTAGTPNGPVSHPLSPSMACSATGPTSPQIACDKTKVKQEKLDKYKMKSVTASPTNLSMSSNSSVAMVPSPSKSSSSSSSSLSVSTPPILNVPPHMGAAQASPIPQSLKPIQPKPSIMGSDIGSVGSSIECLKKEKPKHRKKNRDKDRERKGSSSYGTSLHTSSRDRGGHRVPGMEAHDKLNGSVYSKMTDLLGKEGVSRLSGTADMPLDLNTSSADGNTCNENVQSPAYSDISDANDSTPAMDTEVSGKDKEEVKVKVAPETTPSTPTHNMAPYVYSYYGQPPYVVSPMSTQSPPASRSTNPVVDRPIKEEVVDPERIEEKSPKESVKHWNERSTGSSSSRSNSSASNGERMDSQERLVTSGSVSAVANPSHMVPPPGHVTQHEYQLQQQQKIMQQQYAYHYGYQYHYMEQAYHMQLKASEAPYKQQHHHHHHQQQQQQHHHHHHQQYGADDKDRLDIPYKGQSERHKETSSKEKTTKGGGDGNKDFDKMSSSASDLSKQATVAPSMSMSSSKERTHGMHHSQRLPQQQQSHCSPHMSSATSSSSSPGSSGHAPPGSKVEALSASLKEKQNENHQILKENIELKTQMEKKSNYERYDPSMAYSNSRHEELMRYLLFQEKMDHPKGAVDDMPKKDDALSGPRHSDSKSHSSSKESPKPLNTLPPTSHASSSSRTTSSPKTSVIGGSKESSSQGSKDLSLSGLKKENDSKGNDISCSDSHKDKKEAEQQRLKVQEGQKPTMETQGPPPPTSSYAYMHPAYMQSPHYGPIAFDPTHSVYRGMNPMLMAAAGHYPGSYLPQMRYHVPQPAADQQADMSPKLHQTKALDLLQHHASQYYSSHKIHELQEHAIKSPGAVSSQSVTMCATKITDSTVSMGKMEPPSLGVVGHDRRSPPLQRHLHTHHHTHVGVGYPILGQYDPYGALIVGQQAVRAAGSSSSSLVGQPFTTK